MGGEERYASQERGLRARIAAAKDRREWARCTEELVVLYSLMGRPEEARRLTARLLSAAASTEEQAFHLLQLGQLSEQSGDFDAAAAYYREGIALGAGGQNVRYLLHNNLGYCRNRLGEPAEAEDLCRDAIRVDPDRHNAYKNLGIALELQGRHGEAAEQYLEAAERNPRDGRALQHLLALVEREPGVLDGKPALRRKLDEVALRIGTLAGVH